MKLSAVLAAAVAVGAVLTAVATPAAGTATPPAQHTLTAPQTTTLPLTTKAPYKQMQVAQISIGSTAGVDHIQVEVREQYATTLPYEVMHAELLTANTATLVPAMGSNFDPVTHYALTTMSAVYLPTGTGPVTFTVVDYAASTAAKTGATITVKYLWMQVTVFYQDSAA